MWGQQPELSHSSSLLPAGWTHQRGVLSFSTKLSARAHVADVIRAACQGLPRPISFSWMPGRRQLELCYRCADPIGCPDVSRFARRLSRHLQPVLAIEEVA